MIEFRLQNRRFARWLIWHVHGVYHILGDPVLVRAIVPIWSIVIDGDTGEMVLTINLRALWAIILQHLGR